MQHLGPGATLIMPLLLFVACLSHTSLRFPPTHHGRSFGKVFKALNHKMNRICAVKVVPLEFDAGEVAREIEHLRECDQPNREQLLREHSPHVAPHAYEALPQTEQPS